MYSISNGDQLFTLAYTYRGWFAASSGPRGIHLHRSIYSHKSQALTPKQSGQSIKNYNISPTTAFIYLCLLQALRPGIFLMRPYMSKAWAATPALSGSARQRGWKRGWQRALFTFNHTICMPPSCQRYWQTRFVNGIYYHYFHEILKHMYGWLHKGQSYYWAFVRRLPPLPDMICLTSKG